MPEFDGSPKEQNRGEEELTAYFQNLHEYLQMQADSLPAHPETGALEEKENDSFWVGILIDSFRTKTKNESQ